MIYGDAPASLNDVPVPDIFSVRQSLNLYTYCDSNPILFKDSSGEFGILVTLGIGALVGALFGGGAQVVHNIATGQKWSKDVFKAALGGGIGGAISVIPLSGGWVSVAITGVMGNVVGQMISGKINSLSDVVSALTVGAASGIIGKYAGDLISKGFQSYFSTLTKANQKALLSNIGKITNRQLTEIRQAIQAGLNVEKLDELVKKYGYDVIISAFVSSAVTLIG